MTDTKTMTSILKKQPERLAGRNEALGSTRRGHRTLINITDSRLRYYEDRYDNECGGGDGNGCGAGCAVVTGVAVVGAGYIAYRCLRMLPSLVFPPAWPTIPVNLAVP